MTKLIGVLIAFVLCAGVWLGGLGAFITFLFLYAIATGQQAKHPDWALVVLLFAIGAVSIWLIKIIDKKYPDAGEPNRDIDLTNL